MRRREFIAGLGSVAAWPFAARGQQRGRVPVVGLIQTGEPELIANFIRGLAEAGFIEGRNVVIETRWAGTQFDKLPQFAADLVQRGVDVIATPGSSITALAAKAATTTIPIVFSMGGDPVQLGLVASLNRPGGNITGYGEMNTEVGSKRFELLHELTPKGAHFAVLLGYRNQITAIDIREAQKAAAIVGLSIDTIIATTEDEINTAFASLAANSVNALIVPPSPLFYPRRAQVVALAARYGVPTIYWDRAFSEAGGLMSYGSSVADSFRQVGRYTGRILNGEKPGDLPVVQPTKYELVINANTAMALGLTIPETLLATADEVIQ
jgi:putative ABC transport system substrate-binding protein